MGTAIDPEKKVVYFMSLDNVKFRRPVVPGDQLRLELDLLQGNGAHLPHEGRGLRGRPAGRARPR